MSDTESEQVAAMLPETPDALFVAMAAVGHVPKDSQGHGYKYRGIEAIMQAARPALKAAFMSCRPISMEILEREARPSSQGKSLLFTMVRVVFRYSAPGETFEVTTIGEAFDSGDKGMAKAISVAQRTAHILALQIPTGEDTEEGEQYEIADGGKVSVSVLDLLCSELKSATIGAHFKAIADRATADLTSEERDLFRPTYEKAYRSACEAFNAAKPEPAPEAAA